MSQIARFFHDCRQPTRCTNGKCVATGRCVDCQPKALIAFTGLAGSGKSTAALHMVARHGYQRIRFAGPLKDMMAALGLTPEQIDGDRKELPCALLGGVTPRRAMQTLGTEWGRDIVSKDLWINAWRASFDRISPGSSVVVDDCRFPNEAAAVKAAGGIIVRIERPGAGVIAAGHSSEGQELPADRTLLNDSTQESFLEKIDELARDMSWAVAGTH